MGMNWQTEPPPSSGRWRRWRAALLQRDTGGRASGSRPQRHLHPVSPPPAILRPAVLPLAPVTDEEIDRARQVLGNTPVPASPRDPSEPAWELAMALMDLRQAAHVLSTAVRWCQEEHR